MSADETPYTANEDLYIGVSFARAKGSTVSGAEVKQYNWTDKVSKASGESARTADTASDEGKTNSPVTNTRGGK